VENGELQSRFFIYHSPLTILHYLTAEVKAMSLPLRKRIFTVEEYHRMGAAGVIAPDERVELLEGEIYPMPPIGPPHSSRVTRLDRLFYQRLGFERFTIITQNPIHLGEYSEPQPDLTVAVWREDDYALAHPTPPDVLLVVEVADTTLKTDRQYKLPLYARAGVPEAWLINISGRRVELHAEPVNGAYQIVRVFQPDETIQSHAIPELQLAVSDIFG
jgi:Uma2 family endonuclease